MTIKVDTDIMKQMDTAKQITDRRSQGRNAGLTLRKVKRALEKCGGSTSLAAKKLDVTFSSVYWWIKNNKVLQLVAKRTEEEVLDLAEYNLTAALEQGHKWATEFTLKMKGKSRGYMDTNEVILPNVPITFNYDLMTPDKVKQQREENEEQQQPTIQ
jgi:hypothetical protein|tara:strand:- start:341 stop:811 length:471 start_codon:yes stop_codon:yes gene_type:complete